MTWKPDVTVAAVMESEGRFLLVRERVGKRLVFNQPAGHLEDGESLLAAVIRETLEETGWLFEAESVIGLYRWRQPHRDRTFLRVTFAGRGVHHDPSRTLDPDIHAVVWKTVEELRREPGSLRSPMVLRSIEDYLAGNRYPLSLLADIIEP